MSFWTSITEKAFDSFKKLTPALFAVSIISGLLLFLPESVLGKMGLNSLPLLWRRIIGLSFLLSIALITTIAISSFYSIIKSNLGEKKAKALYIKKLKALSPTQKNILTTLLKSDNKAISLDKNSGDTVYLENNAFIYMPQQAFTLGWDNEIVLTYVPHPLLLELYNKDPELFS